MLAGDPTLTPIAGCTDVYVGLHFGTLKEQRFIDLWQLDELRGIAIDRRPAPHRRADDLLGDHRVEAGDAAGADAGRRVARGGRRADPESRHARRQHRQRLARRRHAAGAGGRRRPRSCCGAPAANAPCRSNAFYTGLSHQRPPAGRADHGDRDSRASTGASGGAKWGRRRAQAISKMMMAGVRGRRRARRDRLGRADRGARATRRPRCFDAAARSPTRRRHSRRRSRRSTISDRRASIGRRWPRTCSRSFGERRNDRRVRCDSAKRA